eukprot:scaffold1697_cov120-Cylindrotheca_fusiformis.AAC.24
MESVSSSPAFQASKNTDSNGASSQRKPCPNRNGGGKARIEPRRSQSLQSSTIRQSNGNDLQESDEIWIEQIVLGRNNEPRTRFMSMKTFFCRKEPPAGARAVIYVGDYLVQEEIPVAPLKVSAPPKKVKSKGRSMFGIARS